MEIQKSQAKSWDFEISYVFLVCCKPLSLYIGCERVHGEYQDCAISLLGDSETKFTEIYTITFC